MNPPWLFPLRAQPWDGPGRWHRAGGFKCRGRYLPPESSPLRNSPYPADSPYVRRLLIALILPAIAVSPAASRGSGSGSSGRSIAGSEPRTHRGEPRSEARNSSTSHTSRARAGPLEPHQYRFIEVHDMRARCKRQDQAEPGGPPSLPEQPSLSRYWQDFRRVSR